MYKFISILLVSIMTISSYSADFVLEVKTANGNVTFQKGGKGNWTSLKKGVKLNNGDQIKLEKGSHLNLVHSNGNPIELDKSGNYSVEKLAAKANTEKSDVTKKFTNYLLDELGDSEDMLAEDNLSDNMSTLGAVERAIPKFSPNDLVAAYPRSSYATGNEIKFSWYPLDGENDYIFVVKNDLEEIVVEKAVAGNEVQINLDEAGFERGFCYYWSVKAGDKKSEELCVYRMMEDEKISYENELNSLKKELDLNKALDNMILASFYSQKKVVPEAIKSYKKAIELAPEVDNYKLVYGKYLMSIGLVKEAKELAKI